MRWRKRREIGRHAAGRLTTPATDAVPVRDVDPGVVLGFSDGSEVGLRTEDPRAKVFRAVADALIDGGIA